MIRWLINVFFLHIRYPMSQQNARLKSSIEASCEAACHIDYTVQSNKKTIDKHLPNGNIDNISKQTKRRPN